MKKVKIGFIGGGNMAEALITAIFKKRLFPPKAIGVSDCDRSKLLRLKRRFGLLTFSSNSGLAESSRTLLLAVKPQQMSEVLDEIGPSLNKGPCLISIAAGLDTRFFEERLPGAKLIRVMPNVAATVGEGTAVLFANSKTTAADRQLALRLFASAGKAFLVSREEWLDPVTALSGSGPAFVFLFLQSLIEAGREQGLPEKVCKELVFQTIRGALAMAGKATDPLPSLISKVASKGGTTEAGLEVLTRRDFSGVIRETIAAATTRAAELRRIF